MKIPKIRFRYSWVYDDRYRNSPIIQKRLKERGRIYPSKKKVENYMKKIKPLWEKEESKILREISKITSLNWKEKEIMCYVIGVGRSFSDPLTVRMYKNKNDFIDVLTHELIHQMNIQNSNQSKKWMKYVDKKYKNESRLTKYHIFLHAVLYNIYLELYDKKRLNRDIKRHQKSKDYKIAWDIVQEEGSESIINKFKEIIR